MSPGDDRVHGGDSLHGALNSVPKVPDLEIINEFRHDISSGEAGASADGSVARTVVCCEPLA